MLSCSPLWLAFPASIHADILVVALCLAMVAFVSVSDLFLSRSWRTGASGFELLL